MDATLDPLHLFLQNLCHLGLLFVDIWSTAPHPVAGSTNWKGVIKDSASVDVEWRYSIGWTDLNGNAYTFDPKIIVNSSLR